jgi:DNA-binding transcriptional ArsR family regulator
MVSSSLRLVNTYVQNGLAALGDPTRLAIFAMLSKHPHAVNELAAGLPISRPAVSQHLKVLKDARLVRDRPEGTRRIYEMDPEGIEALRDHFVQLWDQALLSFKRVAEEEYKKEKEHGTRNGSKRGGKKNPSRGSAN